VAELQPPVALQNVSTLNADDFRGLIQALVPTEGIIASGDLAVTQNGTPNMSVNVAAGAAIIAGDDTPATQGFYFAKNDATKNLTVTAADPTNPRKDIVVAQVRDAFYSGSDNDWRLAVIAGTPAASPSEPSLPNNALKLAVITVAAGATSITTGVITDSRTVAVPLGSTTDPTWASYTPTLTQGGSVSKTVTYAKYKKEGRTVTVNVLLTVTGSGSANNRIDVGLPESSATIGALVVGMFRLWNNSAPNNFVGACAFASTSSVACVTNNNSKYLGQSGAAFALALAAGDLINISLTYEAAS
jgi:hypothetical protein